MDARKLRNIKADSFAQRAERGNSLTAALDDGFAPIEREDLMDKTLVLVAWEMTPGIQGDYAEVWAIAEMNPEDYVKVKFRDGGRSYDGIPRTLNALRANGITENVTCVLTGEPYEFADKETGEWKSAYRYRLETPAGGKMTSEVPIPDDPNF